MTARYLVTYTIVTHHETIVELPDGLHYPTIAPSAAMDVVRRADPLELRRRPARGTAAYIKDATPLPEGTH